MLKHHLKKHQCLPHLPLLQKPPQLQHLAATPVFKNKPLDKRPGAQESRSSRQHGDSAWVQTSHHTTGMIECLHLQQKKGILADWVPPHQKYGMIEGSMNYLSLAASPKA